MIAALACLTVAAAIYALLFFLGWPTWVLIGRGTRAMSVVLAAPLYGLAILELFSWYWLDHGHGGMRGGLPFLLGANAVFGLVAAFWQRRTFRWSSRTLHGAGVDLALGLSAFAAFAVAYREVFRVGRLTSGSIFNADIAMYAAVGRSLQTGGFHDLGNAVGQNLGRFAATTTPGVFAPVSASAVWTGRHVLDVMLPVMFVAILLIALAARDLSSLLGGSRLTAALIGVLAATPALLMYAMANYFLAQFFAMSIVLGSLLVVSRASVSPSRADRWRLTAQQALLALAVVLTYPGQAYLSAPLVLAVVLVASLGHDWRQRWFRAISVGGGGFVVGLLLIPTAAHHALTWARTVSKGAAGWPLPGFTPFQLLGITKTGPFDSCSTCTPPHFGPLPHPLLVSFVAQSALVLGVAALGLRALPEERRRSGSLLLVAAFAALSSYGLVWKLRGYSYVQWKWIAFYQPLLIAACFTLVAALLGLELRRFITADRARRTAAIVIALAVGSVFVARIRPATAPFATVTPIGAVVQRDPWPVVDERLEGLHRDPRVAALRAVNLNLNPRDGMWAVSELAPKRVYVAYPNFGYFPIVPPLAEWTLEYTPRAPEYASLTARRPPGAQRVRLNDRYRLVHETTTEIAPGTLWKQGRCAALYRFDGARWQPVERTERGGEFDLELRPTEQAPGVREAILSRPIHFAEPEGDFLLLERLGGGQARFVYQQVAPSSRVVDGMPIHLEPGSAYRIDVVFDAFLGETRVSIDGQTVLQTTGQFFRPYDLGRTVVGKNAKPIARDFAGQISVLPRAATQCLSSPASEGTR